MAPVPTEILTLKNRTLSSVARLFIKHAREVAFSSWPACGHSAAEFRCPLRLGPHEGKHNGCAGISGAPQRANVLILRDCDKSGLDRQAMLD